MSEDVNEGEEPKLRISTLKDFEEAIRIAKALIDNGDITVKVLSSLYAIVTVDESVLEDALQSSFVSPKNFSVILKTEIADMITALSLEAQEGYTAFVLRNVEDEEEEQTRLIEQKLKIVDDIIVNKAIRDRFLIRATSKVDSFEDIYWEINEKKYTSDRELESLRYATIRLEFTRNPVLTVGRNVEPLSVVFDCDASQIDELINVLSDIREKLEGQEEKE